MSCGHDVKEAEDLLREWLGACGLPTGSRLPSVRILSAQLGMRYYALNRAMTNLALQGVVDRQGYKLFIAGKRAPEKSLFPCDVVVARRSIYLPSYRKVAKEMGIQATIYPWDSTEELVAILKRLLHERSPGVVFAPPSEAYSAAWETVASKLADQDIPVVCVGHRVRNISSVIGDDDQALEVIFRQMTDLGHTDMALMALSPRTSASIGVLSQWRWLCRKYRFTSSEDRFIPGSGIKLMPEEIQKLARQLKGDWKDCTALVVYTDKEYPIQHFLDELSRNGVKVPSRLSVVFLGDFKALHVSTPSVSSTAIDVTLLHETVYFLLRRAQALKAQTGVLPRPSVMRLEQELVLRESTTFAPGSRATLSKNALAARSSDTRGFDPGLEADVEMAWLRPYDSCARVPESRFSTIDISDFVNRPINFRRGWFGDVPLRNLKPGRHTIHGIPFEVMGGNNRKDCGVIVLQSLVNSVGKARKLPSKVTCRIDQPARAIYILHACGYSKFLNRFAVYSFYNGRKKLGEVPIISLGKPPPEITPSEMKQALQTANIQDWWPDYPHFDFPHSRFAPMLEDGSADAIRRHVFLYTLEWINPSPDGAITHIEVTADAAQSTTLGILGVSVLKP